MITGQRTSRPRGSRLEEQIQEDDREIRRLEKRLGVRAKTTKRKRGGGEAAKLYEGSSESDAESSDGESARWLRQKRLKARGEIFSDGESTSQSETGLQAQHSSKSSERPRRRPEKSRENPYVAPQLPPLENAKFLPSEKYVPPSLRQGEKSENEQIRRRVKGLLNRLTEENIQTVFTGILALYKGNPRQAVTSTTIDLLLEHLAQRDLLRKESLIDHAGLVSAIFRVVGLEPSAQILERVVDEFQKGYSSTSRSSNDGSHRLETSTDTHLVNLVGFLAELCMQHVIGTRILLDFLEIFLERVDELHAKLILRIAEVAGPLLRHESITIKDIHKRFVSMADQLPSTQKLTGPTWSALESLGRLSDRRQANSTSDYSKRMRAVIDRICSTQFKHTQRTPDPLNVSLKDIEERETKGKWWIVGASFKDSTSRGAYHGSIDQQPLDTSSDSENAFLPMDAGKLDQLAVDQGMNTPVRRAIFSCLIGALDPGDAYRRLTSLGLSRSQFYQVSTVLLQLCSREEPFNMFYPLIARRVCQESSRKVRVSTEHAVWNLIARLEQAEDGEEIDATELVNSGKFVGRLIDWNALSLQILRRIEWPADGLIATWVGIVLVEAFNNPESRMQSAIGELKGKWEVAAGLSATMTRKIDWNMLVPEKQIRSWRKTCRKATRELDKIAIVR